MRRGTLLRKLIPPIAGAVAALTLLVLLIGVIAIRSAVLERARARAQALSAAERDSFERLMRVGDHGDLHNAVDQVARNPDVAAVRLLDSNGKVSASSFRTEVGMAAGKHAAQSLPGGDIVAVSLAGRDPRQAVHTLQPFINKPACQQCHDKSSAVLGYQDLDVAISEHATGLLTFTTLSGLLGLFYIAAVVGVTAPLIAVVVRRPVSRLIEAMRKVQAGDLSAHVDRTGTREIDAVIDGFNAMVARLQQGRHAEEAAKRLEMERVEQLASVGEMAAGLAHEIRNPISGVKAVVEIVARDTADKERRDVLHDAAGELMRVDSILRELLQYARPKTPVVAPFDLNAIVRDAARLTLADPGSEHQAAHLTLDDRLPAVPGDALQIRQVIVNLLLNARQATQGTGAITVATGRSGADVWCRVQDAGPGVPADRAEAIFRPFVTTKARGTGLGLAISRRIAELHGGYLHLDNPGKFGASFTLTLPAEAATPAS